MALDADAALVLQELQRAMPDGMSAMSIGDLRTALASQPLLDGKPVHAIEDRDVPGPHGPIPVWVYRPRDEADLPVLIWLHGGGFAIGTLDMYDALCRELANAADAIVVSVDYRLAPEHQFAVPVDDCYAATEWVVQNAAAIGGDARRVAIGGDSAGGTLAMAVCLAARDRSGPALMFQLIVYGTAQTRISNLEFADLPILRARDCEWFWQMYAGSDADRQSPLCCPLLAQDLSGLPPAFVLTAEHDPTRDDTEAYAHRLAAAGVRTTLKRYPGVYHGFFSMSAFVERAREAIADAGAALRSEYASAQTSTAA